MTDKRVLAAAKEIRELQFKDQMTLAQVKKKFYAIMRKHGLRWGIAVPGGAEGATAAWAMLLGFFLGRFADTMRTQLFLQVPNDLRL